MRWQQRRTRWPTKDTQVVRPHEKELLAGVLVGLVLLIIAPIALQLGRAVVRSADSVSRAWRGIRSVANISTDTPRRALNGRLIHTSGSIDTKAGCQDPDTQIKDERARCGSPVASKCSSGMSITRSPRTRRRSHMSFGGPRRTLTLLSLRTPTSATATPPRAADLQQSLQRARCVAGRARL